MLDNIQGSIYKYIVQKSNKKTLLVLGNGFDLNCGLNSSFYNYFEKWVKENAGIFNLGPKSDSNIWNCLLYFAFWDDKRFCKTDDVVKSENKSNPFWMDIESFIKKVVTEDIDNKKIRFFHNRKYTDVILDAFEHRTDNMYFCNAEQFVFLKKLFCKRFSWDQEDFDIYKFLYNELCAFESDFKNYISEQVKTNKSYCTKSLNLIKKFELVNNCAYLFSFNYTNPFQKNDLFKIENINYVHGSIKDNDIIIGFDSSDLQNNKDHSIYLSKAWQKSKNELTNEPLPKQNEIEEIKFYGHSLGPQDYSYFHCLFDIFDLYNGKIRLIFLYSDYEATKEKNEINEINYVSSIYSLLDDYSQRCGKEGEHRTLISRLQIENRLIIKKI